MNITSIGALILIFLGGICILAGYMLTNAFHKFRMYMHKRREVKT